VIGLSVIIPESEVYQGADSPIAFGFHEHASSSGHTGPMEDAGVHLLVDLCLVVTGALCRKTDPKIATAPNTQSRSKDHNKDKDNSK